MATYYLMRYYLSKLTLPQIPTNDSFLKSKTKQRLILTNNGIIHLIGDKMYDCKLKDDAHTEPIQNYIDKHGARVTAAYEPGRAAVRRSTPASCLSRNRKNSLQSASLGDGGTYLTRRVHASCRP